MAKTKDNTAQKKRQQMIILAVGGVILLALVAIQGPKLLGGGSTPAPATDATGTTGSTASTTTGSTTTGSTPAAATTTVVAPGAPRTVLVGVTVGGTGSTPAEQGQLRLFTLFKAKDPFVQSLPTETSGTTATTSSPTLSDTEPGSGSAGTTSGTDSSGGGESSVAPTPNAPAYATILVNGENEPLSVKDKFPDGENVFVLVSLKERSAKIAVAGGSFTDAQTVTLPLGKSLTLVNTATGARYALKLVFVGDQPEEVQGFTQGAKKAK
jgi:hypothetical protein